jgi:hypothetical protein
MQGSILYDPNEQHLLSYWTFETLPSGRVFYDVAPSKAAAKKNDELQLHRL